MYYRESDTLELKREVTDFALKSVLAFANSNGGTLIFGIADDLSVCGIESVDATLLRLTNMVRDSIDPDITRFISYKTVKIDGKDVIEMKICKGTNRPYALKGKGISPRGVFVRQGTSTVGASMDTIRMMINDTEHRRYETEQSHEQNLTFVYAQSIFDAREVTFGDIQKKTLRFMDAEEVYTNLGMLLSDQCDHTTKIAIFQGTGMAVFRDRREFSGSLLEQMDKSMDYIQQYNRIRSEFPGLVRSDQYDYPPLALREMLLNAYAHRQYSVSAPTLIRLFDDRIECITVGGLAPGLTMEDIMLGISVSRNEYLTRVFHHLGIMEAYGTGIPRIFEQYNSYACKPEIETSANAFKLTLPNRNYVTEHVGEMEGAYEAYQFIKRNPMCGRLDLQQFLGSSQTHAGVILSRLVEKGVLITHGKGKNTKYSVK